MGNGMKVEVRADGAHISGYVNATEKKSRPVITAKGQRVIEVIEPRTFERALERATNVPMTKDHKPDIVLAETRSGNLRLHEDAIGLFAEALVTDPATVEEARAGKIKGWSFGMKNIVDEIEERTDALPLRRVKGLDLDHITLVVNATPAYAATSVEVRAEDDVTELESRTLLDTPELVDHTPKYDNTPYKERLERIKNRQ
jgi:HK97 family phage prohead protease